MKDFVAYTAARFAVFGVCFGLGLGLAYLIGGTPIAIVWPLIGAALASTAISAYALRGMRDKVAEGVSARAARAASRFEEIRAKEDVD